MVGCIKILLLMCDLSLEPGQTEKTEKADISLTRREICQNAAASDTLVPFQNVMAGVNMTPRYPYYLLLITYFHYLIASKYTACVKISTYLGYYVFFISAYATQRCQPYFAEDKI